MGLPKQAVTKLKEGDAGASEDSSPRRLTALRTSNGTGDLQSQEWSVFGADKLFKSRNSVIPARIVLQSVLFKIYLVFDIYGVSRN